MKKVSLNKNSWHFKYYSWIIGGDAPKTLCPYFWTMVTIILLSPFVIFYKSLSLLDTYVDKKLKQKYLKRISDKKINSEKEIYKIQRNQKISEIIGKILVGMLLGFLLIVLGILFNVIVGKVGWYQFFINLLAVIGFLTTITLAVIGLCEIRIGYRIINSKFIQIPKSMIVAVYTKACPLVEWN